MKKKNGFGKSPSSNPRLQDPAVYARTKTEVGRCPKLFIATLHRLGIRHDVALAYHIRIRFCSVLTTWQRAIALTRYVFGQ
jgi:hypothetical protein